MPSTGSCFTVTTVPSTAADATDDAVAVDAAVIDAVVVDAAVADVVDAVADVVKAVADVVAVVVVGAGLDVPAATGGSSVSVTQS